MPLERYDLPTVVVVLVIAFDCLNAGCPEGVFVEVITVVPVSKKVFSGVTVENWTTAFIIALITKGTSTLTNPPGSNEDVMTVIVVGATKEPQLRVVVLSPFQSVVVTVKLTP